MEDAAAVAAEASAEGASEASESEVVDVEVGGASSLAAAACVPEAASAGASPVAAVGESLDPWSVGASDDSEDIPIPTVYFKTSQNTELFSCCCNNF